MTTTEFKRQIKATGMEVRKRRKIEVFDVLYQGNEIFSVTFAELHPLTDIDELLARKLRPEYIPPLG